MSDWAFDLRQVVEFEVTPEHLKLAQRMYVGWEGCEFGAPAIDCKRPYGNSDVYDDIAEIIGSVKDSGHEDHPYTDAQEKRMLRLHREMMVVLQIALSTGTFRDGRYVRSMYGTDWRLA